MPATIEATQKRAQEPSYLPPAKKTRTLPPSESLFTIEEVTKEKLSKLKRSLHKWEKIAAEKEGLSSSLKEKELFEDSSIISAGAQGSLSVKESLLYLKCKHKDFPKTTQAIASIFKIDNTLFIDSLLTHPHNISAAVNANELKKVRGAGSALIYHIFERCVKENREKVSLRYLDSALSFYQNRGFSHTSPRCISISQEEIRAHLDKIPHLKEVA